MYDISALCTSLVAKDANNKILHGRNLDFWPWSLISKDSATIEVFRGN